MTSDEGTQLQPAGQASQDSREKAMPEQVNVNAGGPRSRVSRQDTPARGSMRSSIRDSIGATAKQCWDSTAENLTGEVHRSSWSGKRISVKDALSEEEEDGPPKHKAVFADAQAMKDQVKEHLIKKNYTVTDYYKDFGIWRKIATSNIFEQMTLVVIFVNACWIAVDTDLNNAEMLVDAHPVFQIAENFFCTYFSFEWTVRFMAFKRKSDCRKDAWFVFDSFLVFLMVGETWAMTAMVLISGQGGSLGNASILRIARLLRLSRMARMARLLRAMPELMILIKGMMAAMRSVFFTLGLLVVIMYVFGVAFTQLMASDPDLKEMFFSGVAHSMYTLLLYGVLLDNPQRVADWVGNYSFWCACLFFLFVLIATLTVMNMLIGVLCEVVSAVAATEKEEMMLTWVHHKVHSIVEKLDQDGNEMISKDEFQTILQNRSVCRALNDIGVDVIGLVDFADVIFADDQKRPGEEFEKELSFTDFMDLVLKLRGTNMATVKDIIDLRKVLSTQMMEISEKVCKIDEHLRTTRLARRHGNSGFTHVEVPAQPRDVDKQQEMLEESPEQQNKKHKEEQDDLQVHRARRSQEALEVKQSGKSIRANEAAASHLEKPSEAKSSASQVNQTPKATEAALPLVCFQGTWQPCDGVQDDFSPRDTSRNWNTGEDTPKAPKLPQKSFGTWSPSGAGRTRLPQRAGLDSVGMLGPGCKAHTFWRDGVALSMAPPAQPMPEDAFASGPSLLPRHPEFFDVGNCGPPDLSAGLPSSSSSTDPGQHFSAQHGAAHERQDSQGNVCIKELQSQMDSLGRTLTASMDEYARIQEGMLGQQGRAGGPGGLDGARPQAAGLPGNGRGGISSAGT